MSPQYFDQFELPPELCAKPLALIGLTGLDTLNNAIHKTIWDAFSSNRRVERPPVTFKLLSNAHEFPVVKPKRNLYEWYIPKGILKRNWMNKHLNELPAVIVIFYDLDWSDPQWNEKMIECSSRVQSMRAALEGRNTRIVVVLIQQTLPLPTGEDVLAAERATALCTSCELNTKSLFVLPLGDHLQGYTVRLETAFYDLAQNYYHHESRNVKSHRELLNKTTHQYLFVRHQFKMGFLNELKQDSHTAHKHYMHAYNNLLELRVVDTNALEIKTVAGFINYKLCRLNFVLSLPRDAISQFRGHIDRFKSRVGFRELAFEHYAWLAKQFTIFGDIFDEAVKLGLPAVQTQHPGFYYQQAAQYASQRKLACLELCQDVKEYPSPDPLVGIEHMDFYGQRPWRPGKLSAEPPDPQKEQDGIQALQYLEKQVNHANIIISYYGLAISQFKTYRCPRMRRHLVVQMADEYFNSNDYGKALTLLTHMLWDYRSEKWWTLISDILQKALNCAYLSANIQDYVMLCLEMLGGHIKLPESEKSIVFSNLNNVLKKIPPEPEKNLSELEVAKAKALWKTAINIEPFLVSVDMSNITSFVDCKSRFTNNKYEADQNVTVEVFIKSTCPYPITFSYLSVTVNTPNYSSEIAIDQRHTGDTSKNPTLQFECNQTKKYLLDFLPDVQDVGQEVQIGSIMLHLGNKNERCVLMRFTGTGCNNRSHPELLHFRYVPRDTLDFENIKALPTTSIVPRLARSQMDIIHDQPALMGEWYPIHISVTNSEKVGIRNIQVKITLEIDEVESELATEFSSSSNGKPDQLPLILNMKDINVDEKSETKFYMRSHRTGDRNVSIKLSYYFAAEKSVESIRDEQINIPVVRSFEITSQYFSSRFEPITKMFVEEMFLVMPQLKCISPWPIVIDNTVFEFNSQIKCMSGTDSQLAKTTLHNEEMGAEVFAAETYTPSDQPVAIGHYRIFWCREGGDIINTTQVPIKGLSVYEVPLRIETVLPAHGYVRTPMTVTYELHNRSSQLLQFDLSMDASEAFMFAGYKQIQISILPKTVKVLKYNMYPLGHGNVALPKLRLSVNEKNLDLCSISQHQLTDLVDRCVPSHVYIMPQVKGNPSSADYAEIMKLMQ